MTLSQYHPEPIDWVFGSEPYIHRLAEEVGARPFPVDPERRLVPVSASKIRENPVVNWRYIPAVVRPYYQTRIVFVGAESTGKTSLATRLAKRLNLQVIPEYGRDYDALFRHGQSWKVDDFEAILKGHNALADVQARRGGPLMIEDTNALQTLVWCEALTGVVPAGLVDTARSMVAKPVYFLLDHATAWVDDGTRHFGDQAMRAFFTERLIYWLNIFDAEWHLISGNSWDEREEQVNIVLQHLLLQNGGQQ